MHCNGKSSGNCPFGFSGRVRNTRSGEAILASSNGGCGASDAKAFPKESDEIATPNVYSLVGLPLRVPETAFVIDRKSVVLGKSVSVRVDLGGRRLITTKN